MEFSPEDIERAKKLYKYKKEYYSNYQKENRGKINDYQTKYLKKVYDDPERLKKMREKQRDYYHNVIKESQTTPIRHSEENNKRDELILLSEDTKQKEDTEIKEGKYNKIYYEEHKDELLKRASEKVLCSCGSYVRKDYMNKHLKTLKHSKNIIQ